MLSERQKPVFLSVLQKTISNSITSAGKPNKYKTLLNKLSYLYILSRQTRLLTYGKTEGRRPGEAWDRFETDKSWTYSSLPVLKKWPEISGEQKASSLCNNYIPVMFGFRQGSKCPIPKGTLRLQSTFPVQKRRRKGVRIVWLR